MRTAMNLFKTLVPLLLVTACSAGQGGITTVGKSPVDDGGRDTGAPTSDRGVTNNDSGRSDLDAASMNVDGGITKPGEDGGSSTGGDGGSTTPDDTGGSTTPGDVGFMMESDGALVPRDTGVTPMGDGGSPPGPACVPGPRELCGDNLDNDCDNMVDEGCACIPGQTQRCFDGLPQQAGRGVCVWGMQRCEGTGEFGMWGACTGSGRPQPVECGRMMDFRCNGMIDEGCTCMPGATRSCYSGPMGTAGVGACRAGSQTCVMTATGSSWGPCSGEVLPAPRDLCDGVDRDCNGMANTGCECVINAARMCYSGPTGTQGVGLCRAGTQRCIMGSSGPMWGACTGEVLPSPDTCDGMDRDCDGNTMTGCTCTVGMTRTCYSGPSGTQGVGVCRAGMQTCVRNPTGTGTSWGMCTGETVPGPMEICANMRDDNCNGAVDEGCTMMRVCPDGYDLMNDPNNCGRCGNRCPPGEACVAGVCVGNGQLRISMTWDRMADLDLHVVPPCGTEIYYGRLMACGGALDVDSCPALSRSTSYPSGMDPCTGPENIFWASAPASGTYIVCANPWRSVSGAPAANFRVTVTRGTTTIRTWTGSRSGSAGYQRCARGSAAYVGEFTI